MPRSGTASNSKRARPFQATCTPSDGALVDAYQLAYWCQWRLAIHRFCSCVDAAGEEDTDLHWVREQRNQLSLVNQTALYAEVRHLESQLGKQASTNAKLEAAVSEGSKAVNKLKLERDAAAGAIRRLEAEAVRQEESAASSQRELRERVSKSESVCQSLKVRVREVQHAENVARQVANVELHQRRQLQEDLKEARQAAERSVQAQGAEHSRLQALEAELGTMTDKYNTLKRRYEEAGRKVESLRAERDTLRRRRAELEDKLADVVKFQVSERGRALDRMEQELASEKMTRVALEADRDDLQTQLAAALWNNSRR